MSKNLSELSGRKGLNENLFEELGIAARPAGTPSVEKMEILADEFIMGKANVYGAASFYDFLKPGNQGKKVYICNGSSCLTAGTQDVLKEKLLKQYKPEEIGEMCCLGRCHENNSFHIGGKNYSGNAIDEIDAIKKNNTIVADKYNVASYGTAVLTSSFPGIKEYYSILPDVLKRSADELLEELKISGLRGRGGAGFPIAFKLDACKKETAKQKFIVCNADEGDPGAYSDRYLLELQPHSVLLGMMIAGYIAGADVGVVYIRAEYPESITITQNAIDDLHKLHLLGENILGSGFNFNFKVIGAQGAYICGEETALLSSIEGQRPEVRVRPPYPVQQGLFNKPTVVNNVETLACIPYIIKNGGKKFASIGIGKSTGTKLISLDGFFNKPGIYEVDMGTPLSVVVNDLGGGFNSAIKAMHIGGPLGGLVPVSKINDLTVDFESFSQNGFLLGHASVVCIPEDFPIIKYLEHLFEFTAHESCGKCFPCRLGSVRGYEMLKKAQESDYKIDRTLLNDLIETLEIGSLCALGGGLPLPIKNALQYFDKELSPYFKKS
ncbi:MAG TPA: NADH-ubiquinone oxidoreductase-F iron-sulfur binding region domain-containing protein [Chitinophagaceae bacterium]|nr:NADH-ubiquinone oxidoreductase-F iron-sulfur binding region domain-containing protein [Chitinophagaceae bacterium]